MWEYMSTSAGRNCRNSMHRSAASIMSLLFFMKCGDMVSMLVTANTPVQRRAARRTVRCNRLLATSAPHFRPPCCPCLLELLRRENLFDCVGVDNPFLTKRGCDTKRFNSQYRDARALDDMTIHREIKQGIAKESEVERLVLHSLPFATREQALKKHALHTRAIRAL